MDSASIFFFIVFAGLVFLAVTEYNPDVILLKKSDLNVDDLNFDWTSLNLALPWQDENVANNIIVDWIGLQNYPKPCDQGEFVSQIDDTLTCSVPQGTTIDTNWETGWTTFDANMKAQYRKYSVDLNTSKNINADGNISTLGKESFNEADWTGGNVTYVPLNGNIQTYINNAVAGDTLVLASGTYNITSQLVIDKQLNIVGQGNSGLVTLPITPSHGTLITSASGLGSGAIQIDANNVRIAHLSLNFTGNATVGINTANNLSGIVLTNIDVILNGNGWMQGFTIYGSNAILRDLTFYVTSNNSTASGIWLWNDSSTDINAIVDCFNVTGTVKGSDTFAYGFVVENIDSGHSITLNLYNSVARVLPGTPKDIGVAALSTTTNNSIINCFLSTVDGSDYDAYQEGSNELNLGGSVIVSNKVFGTVTYRAAVAAGAGIFGGDVNVVGVVSGGTVCIGVDCKTAWPAGITQSQVDANIYAILNNQMPWPDANVADNITLTNLTQITTRNYSDLAGLPSIPSEANIDANIWDVLEALLPLTDININDVAWAKITGEPSIPSEVNIDANVWEILEALLPLTDANINDLAWSKISGAPSIPVLVLPWADANISSAATWSAKIGWPALNTIIPWQDANLRTDFNNTFVRRAVFDAMFKIQDANLFTDLNNTFTRRAVFDATFPIRDVNIGTDLNKFVKWTSLPIPWADANISSAGLWAKWTSLPVPWQDANLSTDFNRVFVRQSDGNLWYPKATVFNNAFPVQDANLTTDLNRVFARQSDANAWYCKADVFNATFPIRDVNIGTDLNKFVKWTSFAGVGAPIPWADANLTSIGYQKVSGVPIPWGDVNLAAIGWQKITNIPLPFGDANVDNDLTIKSTKDMNISTLAASTGKTGVSIEADVNRLCFPSDCSGMRLDWNGTALTIS